MPALFKITLRNKIWLGMVWSSFKDGLFFLHLIVPCGQIYLFICLFIFILLSKSGHTLFYFCSLFCIRGELIYSVESISAVQHSDPVIYISIPFLFHHGLSQENGWSSLYRTAGPHCLSIENVIVCIYHPKFKNW